MFRVRAWAKVRFWVSVLSTKKNYMPYATIQDINTSQSFLARLFNVGSVSVFSAYDNNQMELKNISNPSEVEDIIFSRMVGHNNFQTPPQNIPPHQPNSYDKGFQQQSDDYLGRNDYYDEYEPITPITHESNYSPRRDYEYYPEDLDSINQRRHTYEYEPYNKGFNNSPRTPHEESYYNQEMDEHSYTNDDYYQDNGTELYYNDGVDQFVTNEPQDMDDSSDEAIQRHFDKFKR